MAMMPTMITRTGVVSESRTNNAAVSRTVISGGVISPRVSAVIRRGIATIAIVAVPRAAVVTVAWPISVGAGRYSTDHRTSN